MVVSSGNLWMPIPSHTTILQNCIPKEVITDHQRNYRLVALMKICHFLLWGKLILPPLGMQQEQDRPRKSGLRRQIHFQELVKFGSFGSGSQNYDQLFQKRAQRDTFTGTEEPLAKGLAWVSDHVTQSWKTEYWQRSKRLEIHRSLLKRKGNGVKVDQQPSISTDPCTPVSC